MAGVDSVPEAQELQGQIGTLQEKIEGLQQRFKEASDAAEESEVGKAITSNTKDLEELQSRLAVLKVSTATEEKRKSTRERNPTVKMAEYQQEDIAKRERKFFKRYGTLKSTVKGFREAIKADIGKDEIEKLRVDLEQAESQTLQVFNEIRNLKAPTQQVRERMDRASAMVQDALNALEEVLGSLEGPYDAHDRKEITRDLLRHSYAQSVFSSKATRSQASRHSVSSERVRIAAEVAAKEVQLRQNAEIEAHRAKVKQMEEARDLEALKAQLHVYRKAESSDEEGSQGNESDDEDSAHSPSCEYLSARHDANSQRDRQEKKEAQRPAGVALNPEAEPFSMTAQAAAAHVGLTEHQGRTSSEPQAFDTSMLTQALADTMQRNRLPVPVPQTFSGNPLEYIEFERSFKTLIENRGIPPAEKLYYLKQYLTGAAKEAVEGFFFGATEEAYIGAWKTLQERYGHPFKVQQAFRAKLTKWPKIGPKDGQSLQKFADFLKSCNDAVPFVEGLQVLNDCMENQKLLNKLPDWAITRWNRTVTDSLEASGKYPDFSQFVGFISKEARIANNPISSLGALRIQDDPGKNDVKPKDKRQVTRDKGAALATKGKEESGQGASPQPPKGGDSQKKTPKPCSLCSATDHYVDKCPQFLAKSMAERKEFIQANRLCFGCLRKGHYSQDCKRKLKCATCGKRHPTSLHEERSNATQDKQPREKSSEQPSGQEGSKASATSCKVHLGKHASTSMIVPVWVSSEQSSSTEVLTYALLDTQSDSSFILNDVARALGVNQQPVRLKLSTMTSSSTINCSAISDLVIRGMSLPNRVKLKRCYTRDFIPADRQHIPTRMTAEKWPHLQDIAAEMSALQGCEVGLLIGYNAPQALAPRQVITGKDDEPYAIQTDLGWSIIGYSDTTSEQEWHSQCHTVATREAPILAPKQVLRALEADFTENHHGDKVFSQDDVQFIQHLESTVTQCPDGHLEMPLPFKKRPELPDNRKLALVRLKHLQSKIDKDKRYKEHYLAFMADIINRGFAERAEGEAPPGAANYIPHHGVYHPKKKDKIRVVFDCSAKYAGTCLNEHLLKGPDLTNALVGVLCRFRQHHVALMCDVEKMFFQFRVEEGDRDFLRFLWWEDGDTRKNPVDYRMTVHLFGAASSPGCANYGLKYMAKQYKEDFPLASRFLERNFYVDDGLVSVPNLDEAISLAAEARELCRKGGLRLHKFISSHRPVVESVPKSEQASEIVDLNLDMDELPMERALGIMWNVNSDSFCFQASLVKKASTRRGILSTVASLYDPLGFVAPVVLNGKRILQEMCRSGMGWDDPIPQTLEPIWEQWCDELSQLDQLELPRCYNPPDFGQVLQVELHHFSDASEIGYGQCSYVRLLNEAEEVHCSLVFAKSRVAPTKVATIPRLELAAAVVSAKVSSMLKEELDYEGFHEFFWTDSQVVLGYIKNEARRFHTFVANRVQMIRERSSPEQWHYVSTDENPADHASRGLSAGQLHTTRWFKGPAFLWEKELKYRDTTPELSVGDPEVRAAVFAVNANSEPIDLLERLARISDWPMMVKALTRLRLAARGPRQATSIIQERNDAEVFILQMVQKQAFADEIALLKNKKTVCKTSKIHDLDPYVDDAGTLRVGGRLGKANLSASVAHPAILPKSSHVTKAIVRHLHHRIHHQGRGITQNSLRANGYWIVSGSRVVADLIRNCVQCRRLRRPEEQQKMSDLPEDRVEQSPPFFYVGMDCFGPFRVKKGRSEVKRYGLLFTCLCSRGIHIEMVDDLSTDAFMLGLRSFIAIRGAVRRIRCDQGTNFVGADNELKAAMNEMDVDKVSSYLAEQQCEFVFHVPHSSHAGGVWERQIRTVRNVLRATIELCPGRLNDASLRTLFYEAMAIVNSRPLTPANLNDPHAEILTPNHLLTMKAAIPLPAPGQFSQADLYARKAWRRVQYLLEQFWSRWRKEYLLNLQQRKKWAKPCRNLQVGDVVLLTDSDLPRMKWPLGRVTAAKPSADGLVRQVQVRVGTGNLDNKGRPNKKLSELTRPVQKLILLLECPQSADPV